MSREMSFFLVIIFAKKGILDPLSTGMFFFFFVFLVSNFIGQNSTPMVFHPNFSVTFLKVQFLIKLLRSRSFHSF